MAVDASTGRSESLVNAQDAMSGVLLGLEVCLCLLDFTTIDCLLTCIDAASDDWSHRSKAEQLPAREGPSCD
jgi:hypothetical protein